MEKANREDYEKITSFYRYVSDNTKDMETFGRWDYGKHPTDEMIKNYIDGGYMYYQEADGKISFAVAVTSFQGEDYHPVKWQVETSDDQVAVVHILCTNPDLQGQGLGKQVMKEIVEQAKADGMKAVRLDALSCNKPAHKLYEGLGFVKCGVQNWYAENTGWIDFYLYEYVL